MRFTTLALSELHKNGGRTIDTTHASVARGPAKIDLELNTHDPEKWTAKSPYLYQVELSLDTAASLHRHAVTQRIGFHTVQLIDGLLTVNGKPIKLRGVNRHEHHPLFGRAVPMDFAKKDLILMKMHSVNALRFSHQPTYRKLLDLCDD